LDKGKDGAAQKIFTVSSQKEAEYCCEEMMEDLPNKSMRPSAASRKEIVSTPSVVTGTFANDCCD
jgi:hypothetical protein